MKKFVLSGVAVALASWPSVLPAATYQIDPAHSVAGFTVRHMMVSNVSGAFSKLSGTVDFDSNNPSQSKIDVTIDPASVDTRNSGRDNDLRSANFFDVANYPAITFKSTRVDKAGEGKYRVVGLTGLMPSAGLCRVLRGRLVAGAVGHGCGSRPNLIFSA